MSFTLIPVIEFSAEYFQKETRNYLSIDDANYRETRTQWWKDMLSNWGIENVSRYRETDFVKIEDISDHALSVLTKLYMEEAWDSETDTGYDIDCVSIFEGGFILETESTQLLPQCCGDLGNLDEWVSISESRTLENHHMWVGHPTFLVTSLNNDQIQISTTFEYPSDDKSDIVIVDQKVLQAEVQKVKTDILTLKNKVKIELDMTGYGNTEAMASHLCGVSQLDIRQ